MEAKIKFPTKAQTEITTPFELTGLYYGREGVGKTTLLAQEGKPLFLMFEPGRKANKILKIDVTSWKNAKEIVDALCESKEKQYDRVVFDTADLAWEMCERWTCKKLAINDLADEEWGKAFKRARTEFQSLILALLRGGYSVNFTSHSVIREVEDEEGSKAEMIMPTMARSAQKVIVPICDMMVYMTFRKGKRLAYIRGTENVQAKCVPQDNFLGVDRIDMGASPKEAYSAFIQAFKNGVSRKAESKTTLKLKRG